MHTPAPEAAPRRVMSAVVAAIVAVMGFALLVACTGQRPDDGPVAAWNGGQLQRAEYLSWIAWQGLAESEDAIRKLALIKSMAEAGRERGLVESPQVQLAAEAARHRILMPALDDYLDTQVDIPDEEIEQWRTAHPEAFQQPRKLLLRGIYKQLPDDEAGRQAVHQHMLALRSRVVEGADLQRLAVEESDSQSRFRNGSIGFVDPASLPPAVREAVEGLDVGEVSELIELPEGLAFYACEDIKPASRPDADEVRGKLRQNLYRQKRADLNREIKQRLTPRVRVTPEEDPVLTVGDYSLPREWITPLIRQRIEDRDPNELTPRQKRRLLTEWGFRVAMSDHAESIGLDESEPYATALRWRLDQALATEELRHRVDEKLTEPGESELRALFEQRRQRLSVPPSFRVAAIQFAGADEGSSAEAIERAQNVLARIDAGELDFSQAAREFSKHHSARDDGNLGWLTQQQIGSLDVRLIKPVRQLSPGENTGLMRVHSGLWAVKLLEQRDATPMGFEQAREQLAESLAERQIQRAQEEVREQRLEAMQLKILAN